MKFAAYDFTLGLTWGGAFGSGGAVHAQGMPEGLICCDRRYQSGDDWIGDINNFTPNVIPVGSSAKSLTMGATMQP